MNSTHLEGRSKAGGDARVHADAAMGWYFRLRVTREGVIRDWVGEREKRSVSSTITQS